VNRDIGYIDPARRVSDQGVGNYDDPPGDSCFDHDEQRNSKALATKEPHGKARMQARTMEATMLSFPDLSIQLSGLMNAIQELHLSVELFEKIKMEIDSFGKNHVFPFAEQAQLAQYLNAAADKAQKTNKLDEAASLRKLAKALQPKNGADCRAPIMLVAQ